MKLLTKDIYDRLLRNGEVRDWLAETGEAAADFMPVVKLFTPDANGTWILTDLDPRDTDVAYGLCDLGMGYPECGTVRISEISNLRGKLGLPVERDRYFDARHTLSVYARAAYHAGAITERECDLQQAASELAEERGNDRASDGEGGAS